MHPRIRGGATFLPMFLAEPEIFLEDSSNVDADVTQFWTGGLYLLDC
jgi:hypothetical protein